MAGVQDQEVWNGATLPVRLDAATVMQTAVALRDLAGAPLRLDAGSVRHLGGLGLELLLRAERDWRRAGTGFCITPRSAKFDAALTDLGIDPMRFNPEPV
ncbi:MAG TPA: STAS domain-containing protein [Paenirhodobacter sp.]